MLSPSFHPTSNTDPKYQQQANKYSLVRRNVFQLAKSSRRTQAASFKRSRQPIVSTIHIVRSTAHTHPQRARKGGDLQHPSNSRYTRIARWEFPRRNFLQRNEFP